MKYSKSLSLIIIFNIILIKSVTPHNVDSNVLFDKYNYSPIFYSYDMEEWGKFKVYVKVERDNYILFNIEHEVSEQQFKNLWRVKESYWCKYDGRQMNTKFRVLTGGENEFVWFSERPNVGEATGGFHGNERIDLDTASYIRFVADDKRINLSKNIELTPCSNFHYTQYSTMHQVGTGGLIHQPEYTPVKNHPIECYHLKKTTFTNQGYSTHNKVIWTDNKPLVDRVFYGIFCVDKNVSSKAYNVTPNIHTDTITFVDDGEFKMHTINPEIVLFNDKSGVSVRCNSKIIKGEEFNLITTIWDHQIYHKYYSAIDNDKPIFPKKGEVWIMESSIKFSTINGNQ